MTYVCYRTEHIEAEEEDEYGCLLLPCEHPKLLGPVTATPFRVFFCNRNLQEKEVVCQQYLAKIAAAFKLAQRRVCP
jgi:hypothetical protein